MKYINNNLPNVVSISGKDSTAMVLRMYDLGYDIDYVVYVDTGLEYPEMKNHIKQVSEYIKKDIIILKPKYDFDYLCLKKIVFGNNGYHIGYGMPSRSSRWCNSELKIKPLKAFEKKLGKINDFVGIAYGEQKRCRAGKIYPLVDWKMTEERCLEYCYDRGFDFSGLYERVKRTSCMICPLMCLKDWKAIYEYYNDMFLYAKYIEQLTGETFRRDYSLEELEQRFEKEGDTN